MSGKKIIFQQIISDFFERSLDKVKSRDIVIPVDIPKIVSLLGPRRSGKTYLLFHTIHQLRRNIPKERLVYINFEDDRLFPLSLEDMDDLLRAYYELFPELKNEQVWFFFDEIQEVSNWEKFIRRIYDQENCRIYLTGSSSKLLSRELASVLRGRSISYEVLPLSFKEFVRFNEIDVNPATSRGELTLLHYLQKYLRQGGFPELVFLPEDVHLRIVNEYIDLLLYRDLTERFAIKHPHLIKYLLKHILVNLAKPLSVSKMCQDIKSQGYTVGKNTIYDYVSYMEDAFAIFKVEIWTQSIRKKAVNPGKRYAIDPAFRYAMSMQEDKGRVFENIVFLELRRRGIMPSYVQGKQEVDFFWEGGKLINACYEYSSENTRERELNGLLEAMDQVKPEESLLITWDKYEDLIYKGKKIEVRPLWRFLLEDK